MLNIPAFRAIKQTYPSAQISLVVSPPVEELAACINFIDRIVTWESRRHSIFEILSFLRIIRKERFDLCVIFNPSKELNLISYLAKIPWRVGYARKWGFLLTHKIADLKHLGDKHEIDHNLKLAHLAGANSHNRELSITVDADLSDGLLKQSLPDKGEVLVAIHPWTSDLTKQWPLNNFFNLARRLTDELKVKVLIVGGNSEIEKSHEFCRPLPQGLINLTGKTNLKQLAALLKRCRLLISNDSGPAHLAACVGTAVIALFRDDCPAKGYLRWGPSHKDAVVIARNKLSDITVEEVFNKAKKIII